MREARAYLDAAATERSVSAKFTVRLSEIAERRPRTVAIL